MRLINEKLADDLLEAGKKEFMKYGFQSASMRNIAASAGVTTGALYRYYNSKSELFIALVDKAANMFFNRYKKRQQSFASQSLKAQLESLPEISDSETDWMMEYIYDNFDAFKLIVCHSVGTKYENYIDSLIEIEVDSSHKLIARMQEAGLVVSSLDDGFVHIISSALFNGIFETVRHNMPKDKAIQYVDSLKDFYSAGWFNLLGLS